MKKGDANRFLDGSSGFEILGSAESDFYDLTILHAVLFLLALGNPISIAVSSGREAAESRKVIRMASHTE